MLPVPTVAPRAAAVAAKALLFAKIFPKVFFKMNPALLIGKKPDAAVKKIPAPITRKRSAGPQIVFEIASSSKGIFSVLHTSFL